MAKVVIYARVSTQGQDYERQLAELRDLIRSRMKSGYNHYRAVGGKVGRKNGYRKSDEAMKEQYQEEIKRQILRWQHVV